MLEKTGKFEDILYNEYAYAGLQNTSSLPAIRTQNNQSHMAQYNSLANSSPPIKPHNGSHKELARIKKTGGDPSLGLQQKYAHQLAKFEQNRQNPAFKNGSSAMKSIFADENASELDLQYQSPSRKDQLMNIERKMQKISHIIGE